AIDGDAIGRHTDSDQCMINAPHRSEQSYERRCGTDGGKHCQAILEFCGFLVDDLANGACHEGAGRTFFLELERAVLGMVILRVNGMAGQMCKGLAGTMRTDLVLDLIK